ncbi:hypothetical protein HGA91_03075 [candidate division WWE3 bacterium]|nr:hypothetical protein [candidate division WWE3 bacterium]
MVDILHREDTREETVRTRRARPEQLGAVIPPSVEGLTPWREDPRYEYRTPENLPWPAAFIWVVNTAPRRPGDKNTQMSRRQGEILWAAPMWSVSMRKTIPPTAERALSIARRKKGPEIRPDQVSFALAIYKKGRIRPHSDLLGEPAGNYFELVFTLNPLEIEAILMNPDNDATMLLEKLDAQGYLGVPADPSRAEEIKDRVLQQMVTLIKAAGRTDLLEVSNTADSSTPSIGEGDLLITAADIEAARGYVKAAQFAMPTQSQVATTLALLEKKGRTLVPTALLADLPEELLTKYGLKRPDSVSPAPAAVKPAVAPAEPPAPAKQPASSALAALLGGN